ncbi:SH3 domain-containing protein [Uliginosibacterium sp. sgz301328]|uniref:SH3 domain-containing protein n=1 Tax=Uliginosibacterium sp. sgz301328 TaxID=3243764 RepID=UPI00359CF764
MRKMLPRLALAGAGLLLSAAASALDIHEMGGNAIVYDAGSVQAKPQFILLRGTPVEQIVTTDKWVKIREAGGGMGWVERSQLVDRTHVIVTAAVAEIRRAPDANAPIVFTARKDVLLDVADKPASGWVKVQHADGQNGYVLVRSVWGL